jgi:hypothetical protein
MTKVSHMTKLTLAVTAVTSMLVTLATGAIAQAAPPILPAAIICYAQTDQSWRVGYLLKVNKNGDAIYITPDGRLSTMVDTKGVVTAPTNRPAGVDCYGKTLDEFARWVVSWNSSAPSKRRICRFWHDSDSLECPAFDCFPGQTEHYAEGPNLT